MHLCGMIQYEEEESGNTERKGRAMTLQRLLTGMLVLVVIGGSTVLAGPAQDVLGDLARSERSARMTNGYVSIGLGVAIGVGSVVVLAGTGTELYGILVGTLVALPGVFSLMVPTAAEREWAEAGESEIASALALERLADMGRQERIISGIANLAAGIASLLYPFSYFTPYDYVYSAVSSFGSAAMDFLLPSKEERAFATYVRLAEQGP